MWLPVLKVVSGECYVYSWQESRWTLTVDISETWNSTQLKNLLQQQYKCNISHKTDLIVFLTLNTLHGKI